MLMGQVIDQLNIESDNLTVVFNNNTIKYFILIYVYLFILLCAYVYIRLLIYWVKSITFR